MVYEDFQKSLVLKCCHLANEISYHQTSWCEVDIRPTVCVQYLDVLACRWPRVHTRDKSRAVTMWSWRVTELWTRGTWTARTIVGSVTTTTAPQLPPRHATVRSQYDTASARSNLHVEKFTVAQHFSQGPDFRSNPIKKNQLHFRGYHSPLTQKCVKTL